MGQTGEINGHFLLRELGHRWPSTEVKKACPYKTPKKVRKGVPGVSALGSKKLEKESKMTIFHVFFGFMAHFRLFFEAPGTPFRTFFGVFLREAFLTPVVQVTCCFPHLPIVNEFLRFWPSQTAWNWFKLIKNGWNWLKLIENDRKSIEMDWKLTRISRKLIELAENWLSAISHGRWSEKHTQPV